MALQLLDDSGRFVPAPTFCGTVDEHVCVLLLFEGYTLSGCRLAYDRRWIVQQLLATAPFREFYQRGRNRRIRGGLLLFSEVVPPVVPLRYGLGPTCNGKFSGVDGTAFENFVARLSYPGFLDGRSVWLDSASRSFGMVGIALNEFRGRANHPPRYFTITGGRETMSLAFVHELGHGFELADEYEDSELVGSCVEAGNSRWPNVVSRNSIELGAHPPVTTPLNVANVQLDRIPWAQYLSDPPLVVDHPRRPDLVRNNASFVCSVGDLVEAGGVGPQSRIGLWEGGHYASFNTFRAEPYCVMRNESARIYNPYWAPARTTIRFSDGSSMTVEFGDIVVDEPVGPQPPPPPPPPECGPDPTVRWDTEPTRLEDRVANAYVPFCRICEQWIRYRFGLPDATDVDEWRPGQNLETRIDAFTRWLGRHG